MMVTIGVYVRRGQRLLRSWLRDARTHVWLQSGAYFLAGLLMAAASLGNRFQSLALGLLCATSGWPALLLASGGMIGYFLFWGLAGSQAVVWLMVGLLLVCTAYLVDGSFSPFLYFRF